MPVKRNYIPASDSAFYDFGKIVIEYAGQNHERWGAKAPTTEIKDTFEKFQTALQKCLEPNCGSLDRRDKNVLKAKLEKLLRDYIQGHIARNVDVTETDKVAMSLPVYDRTPTSVAAPTAQAAIEISYPGIAQLLLQIKPISGMTYDPKANYGCRIYFDVYADNQTPPASGEDLRQSIFTRHKKELFTFRPGDSRKIAYFCVRYENSKGVAGPWGPMVSANIP